MVLHFDISMMLRNNALLATQDAEQHFSGDYAKPRYHEPHPA